MSRQKDHLEAKLAQVRILQGQLPALSTRILDLVRDHIEIGSAEIETLTGESRSTIKLRLNELMQRGLLRRHGRARVTRYTLA